MTLAKDQVGSFWLQGQASDASPGGSTQRGKRACGSFPCNELEQFLAANPHLESPLLREYIRRQQQPIEQQ